MERQSTSLTIRRTTTVTVRQTTTWMLPGKMHLVGFPAMCNVKNGIIRVNKQRESLFVTKNV